MLPFVILGSYAKIANNKIQKRMNSTKDYLQIQGASLREIEQTTKERQLEKMS